MSWMDILQQCYDAQHAREMALFDSGDEPESPYFSPGLSDEQITEVEALLGSTFPPDYRALLNEFENVRDETLWSIDLIVANNLDLRDIQQEHGLYAPFDDLIFFGGAGNGDQFAVTVPNAKLTPGVYIWSHENDSRNLIAPTLAEGLLKIYSTSEQDMLEWCHPN